VIIELADRIFEFSETMNSKRPGRTRIGVLQLAGRPLTDAEKPDPTITRCLGFARLWGYGSLVVCNLYALRSTDPKQLRRVADPIGPENDGTILRWALLAPLRVAAWGAHGRRGAHVRRILAEIRLPLHHLGLTKDGHPRHPLYLPASTMPTAWGSLWSSGEPGART